MARREPGFIAELLQSITSRGMSLFGRGPKVYPGRMADLAEHLLSRRGEVSGTVLARALLDTYCASGQDERQAFLRTLCDRWGPDLQRLESAIAAYRETGAPAAIGELHQASEPLRQEILRRLNMAPQGTLALVDMRADLLEARDPALAPLDRDFAHLFASWFNRGFLHLRTIEWSTPANILEKIIAYEAVHEISDWNELRARLVPRDRRCFAFFHPRLPEEPLIFVEVALTTEISARVDALLAPDRTPIDPADATTAVFYSISNCQPGLAGVSFGSLLIKQVVDDLRAELPRLRTFATLSPLPRFAAWLAEERASDGGWIDAAPGRGLAPLDNPDWHRSDAARDALRDPLLAAAAQYLLRARDGKGRPADPVARFHLGNGARLERLNFLGDPSPKGLAQSHGVMVNYLYDLDEIERNHEAFAQTFEVIASGPVRRRLPQPAGRVALRKLAATERPASPEAVTERP